jgi:hypothetical protein
MKFFAIINSFALASTATAFSPRQVVTVRRSQLAAASASMMLNDLDTLCMLNPAEYCTNEECLLDDVEAMIYRLDQQELAVETRLVELRSLANTLDPFHEIDVLKNPGVLMNDIDTMCTVNLAEYCAQESCSLDDVDALVNRLEQQSQALVVSLEESQCLSLKLRTQNRMPLRHHDLDPLIQSIQSALSMEKGLGKAAAVVNGDSHAFGLAD